MCLKHEVTEHFWEIRYIVKLISELILSKVIFHKKKWLVAL